jgi:hypothetical protein
MRDLVRRALYMRRYRQAVNDPAFRELLRTFDDMVGRRMHHLEQRLRGLMDADFDTLIRLIAYMNFVVSFDAEELKQLRLELAPDSVTDEEFTAAWQARFDSRKQRALSALNKTLATRQKQTADRDQRHQGFDPGADDEPGGAAHGQL